MNLLRVRFIARVIPLLLTYQTYTHIVQKGISDKLDHTHI